MAEATERAAALEPAAQVVSRRFAPGVGNAGVQQHPRSGVRVGYEMASLLLCQRFSTCKQPLQAAGTELGLEVCEQPLLLPGPLIPPYLLALLAAAGASNSTTA